MNYDPKDDLDNHANQLNPNNDAYWQSRGEDERPEDWDDDDDEMNRLDDLDDVSAFDDDGFPFFPSDL